MMRGLATLGTICGASPRRISCTRARARACPAAARKPSFANCDRSPPGADLLHDRGMRLTSRDSSDSSAAAWRVLLQRFVHMFAGTAPGVSAGTLQIVVRPFEWDVGNPAYGPYLEWTLAASIPAWGHYVTLGAAPRYVYEGYRDAIEHGFPLPASARPPGSSRGRARRGARARATRAATAHTRSRARPCRRP